ncbi:MAG: hypothetical protein COB42_05955 [Sulfurimonas sp.]|nr:MAG: hypothetical protein COB42_05955 [Sulfurimonas sp.]
MGAKLSSFIDNLIMYDYILFGSAFVLFILFISLGLVFRRKIALALFLILLGFSILFLTPTIAYKMMHAYLFKNTIILLEEKKLEYTDAIVVKGSLLNESKFHFSKCKITVHVHKVSRNKYRNYLMGFQTIKKMSIIQENISKGETKEFKLIVEPFRYSRDYNITLGAQCK